ncbi:MAG TPA: hypothetical protein VIE64_07790 [Solirubrobacterales bacterium]|jgi:hypothetical protein
MESVRQKWTDERLDDLNHRVDEGFRESREETRALRTEMNTRFDAVDARFDAMQRTMVQVAVAMTAAYLAGFAGLAALIATQL